MKNKIKDQIKNYTIFSVTILVIVGLFVNTNKTQKAVDEIIEGVQENKAERLEEAEPEVISQSIREVTAYNVGDPSQTDETPCIGAYPGVNLCEQVENGVGVCATNSLPFGTKLLIEAENGWSHECIVWDRMNSRYTNRVDIAMSLDEIERAKKFGLQNLSVKIIK